MNAVSPAIVKTIIQLQSLPSLANFSLAGGTNLALRYNHRISDDIDLFCPDIIGMDGFNKVIEEVKIHFGKNARNFDFPCDINDQYCFLRFFVDAEDGTTIKIELLQNMKHLFDIEMINNTRLFSKADIGLYKLVSLANRSTKKDVYDLDFITEEINIVNLYENLIEKTTKFSNKEHQTIFDLDKNESVLGNPELLIRFDNTVGSSKFPAHTNDNINIVKESKTWIEARISWRSKVRELYNHLGKDFPKPKGIDIS